MATDNTNCNIIDLELDKFGINENGNLVVRVEDECAKRLLGEILTELGGTPGTPIFVDVPNGTSGAVNVQTTILSSTVPALTTRTISKVKTSTRSAGKFEILIAGSVVGSLRTGPAQMNEEFNFEPGRVANAGETIEVKYTLDRGATGQDVEVYLMATDNV